MFIFAAITTIKQSNLHPCQVISKLPSTSTVQAASENKQKFPLFTEKKGRLHEIIQTHVHINNVYITIQNGDVFSWAVSGRSCNKKNRKEGKKRQPGDKAFTVCWLLRKNEDAVWQSVFSCTDPGWVELDPSVAFLPKSIFTFLHSSLLCVSSEDVSTWVSRISH